MRTILPQILLLGILGIGAGLLGFSIKSKSRELVLIAPPGPLNWRVHDELVLVDRRSCEVI